MIYTAFIDFEEALDSLHKEYLWRIQRHYRIPQKIVNVIKILYTDIQCQVACNSHMTDSFSIKSGVKQGCILSPFLFIFAIDWLMTEITKDGNRGIRWTLTSILEDLDCAYDIGLLSSRHKDIQEKMDKLTKTAPHIRLKLNTAKTKLMRNNYKTDNPITITNNDALEEVQDFTYLGSKITTDGVSAKDAMARIRKASQTFAKLIQYNSNVLSVLLYGSECWKLTAKLALKLEAFRNRCLRKILGLFCPNTITNEELHRKTDATSLATQIKRRRWRWLGHMCRMSPGALPKTAFRWTADSKRRRGRPKETWRRTVEKEMN